ncbi:hypothetical protein NMG60_11016361 [Bertholletia excelsa]
MGVHHIRTLPGSFASFSALSRRFRNFSSSSLATESPRKWRFFSDESEDSGSSVYRHALKFQPPSTIKWTKSLCNSVSFIGTVDRPLERIKCAKDRFGAYTLLRVETFHNSRGFFKILLKMWGEMAHISIKHLKENDSIYVSGHLQSYRKVGEDGKLSMHYEVLVKEINFVMQCGKDSSSIKSKQSDSGGSRETAIEKYRKRIRLWQLFFYSPSEWWDYRGRKRSPNLIHPNHPDFKHKDTGEALWINDKDPLWIKRQLQLYDSGVASKSHREDNSSHSSLFPWVCD